MLLIAASWRVEQRGGGDEAQRARVRRVGGGDAVGGAAHGGDPCGLGRKGAIVARPMEASGSPNLSPPPADAGEGWGGVLYNARHAGTAPLPSLPCIRREGR
jgi:hypothetical protein